MNLLKNIIVIAESGGGSNYTLVLVASLLVVGHNVVLVLRCEARVNPLNERVGQCLVTF